MSLTLREPAEVWAPQRVPRESSVMSRADGIQNTQRPQQKQTAARTLAERKWRSLTGPHQVEYRKLSRGKNEYQHSK